MAGLEVSGRARRQCERYWAGKENGGRCRIRTYDFHRVKVTLYR
jgi:hypothetical protein